MPSKPKKPSPAIVEFTVGAKHQKNGTTVHASMTVEVPDHYDYLSAVAEAQIELRTLLKRTWDEQMKTRDSL